MRYNEKEREIRAKQSELCNYRRCAITNIKGALSVQTVSTINKYYTITKWAKYVHEIQRKGERNKSELCNYRKCAITNIKGALSVQTVSTINKHYTITKSAKYVHEKQLILAMLE